MIALFTQKVVSLNIVYYIANVDANVANVNMLERMNVTDPTDLFWDKDKEIKKKKIA